MERTENLRKKKKKKKRERERERESRKTCIRGEPACVLIGWLEMSVRREFPEKKVFYPREVEERAPALPSLKQTKGLELKERRSWRRKGAPAWETCSLKWWIS